MPFPVRFFKHFLASVKLIILSGCFVFVIVLVISFVIYSNDKHEAIKDYRHNAARMIAGFKYDIQRHTASILSMETIFNASALVTPDEFAGAALYFHGNDKHIRFIAYLPRTSHQDRSELETVSSQYGLETFPVSTFQNGKKIRLPPKKEYYPVQMIAPYQGNRHLLGVDFASNTALAAYLQKACDNDSMIAISTPEIIKLFYDKPHYFVIKPLYKKHAVTMTKNSRRQNITGYLAGCFDFDYLFNYRSGLISANEFFFRLDAYQNRHYSTIYSTYPVISHKHSSLISNPWYYYEHLRLHDHLLRISVLPKPHSALRKIRLQSLLVLIVALIIITAAAAFLIYQAKLNATVQKQVDSRTAELLLLLDNSDSQIWSLKDPETYRNANAAHACFFNRKPEDFADQPLSALLEPCQAGQMIRLNQMVFSNPFKQTVQQWLVNHQNEKRLFAITQIPKVVNDNIEYIICMAVDITDLSKTKELLKDKVQSYNIVFNSCQNGLIIWALNTAHIIDCNCAALHFLGYKDSHDLIGQSLMLLFEHSTALKHLTDSMDIDKLKENKIISSPCTLVINNGTTLNCRHETRLFHYHEHQVQLITSFHQE